MALADREAGNNGGVGLALGGGAALGWAHIGVIRELHRRNLPVGAVAGTSIGSIVGASLAAGLMGRIEEIARSVSVGTMLSYMDPSFARGAIIGGRKIEAILSDYFGGLRIESLPIPFAAIAADLRTGEAVPITDGPLVEALMASIAVPVIFKPVRRGGRLLVDGGLAEPVPLHAVRALGAKKVVAVDLTADYEARVKRLNNANSLPIAANFHIARAAVWLLIKKYSEAQQALDPADVTIRPRIGHIDSTDFTKADALIAAGRDATADVGIELDQLLEFA